MNKKSINTFSIIVFISLILIILIKANIVMAASGTVTRISGANRYETAANLAVSIWITNDNVVLVNGSSYADSINASILAKKLDAPVLFTTQSSLNESSKLALDKLKPKKVYIIGETGVISMEIRNELRNHGYNLIELGGATRYDTNLSVAKELVKLGASKDNIFIVNGGGYSDALSIASIAASKNGILLFVNNNISEMKNAIDFTSSFKVTAVGTSNMISDSIYNAFKANLRISGGADRFQTNLKILEYFKSELKTDKLYIATASINKQNNLFADALIASAAAGKYSASLLLVDSDNSKATTNALDYIKSNFSESTDLQVVGGTGVISDVTFQNIKNALNSQTDKKLAVQSINAVSLNAIKIVFSGNVDCTTAEDITNYKINGVQLINNSNVPEANAKAVLQEDNKTVLITLSKPKNQSENAVITVKNAILSEDKLQSVSEFTENINFSDTSVPVLSSVNVRGNNKLLIGFSEPVDLGNPDLTEITGKFKINGQNISNFGLDNSMSKIKNYIKCDNSDDVCSSELELYFSSPLPSGNNILTVSNGAQGILTDAAGFPLKETLYNFTVDILKDTPNIISIISEDIEGKVYVNFDRTMDVKTAGDINNYEINNDKVNLNRANIEIKNGDTQIKITGAKLNTGSNILYINNNIRDAYGNSVGYDVRKSFDLKQDTDKPQIIAVTTLDDSTIRIIFNKEVNLYYAENRSNYKIKDNDGIDITNNAEKGIDTISAPGNMTASSSVFDIKMKGKLTDSKYTIVIKNVIDMAAAPNTMNDYISGFSGDSYIVPNFSGNVYAVQDLNDVNDYRKVFISFSKVMDSSSLVNTVNYKFLNGTGDVKPLPQGSILEVSSDNKGVTITFPSRYGTDDSLTGGSKSGDNLIKKIAVTGVKDINGNEIGVSGLIDIVHASAASKTTVVPNSLKIYYDGDDLKAQVKFTRPVDSLNYKNFLLNGVQPDSGYKDGDNIIFVFNDENYSFKINVIKSVGNAAQLTYVTDSIKTTDVLGNEIQILDVVNPYYYDAVPKTITKDWKAGVISTTDDFASQGDGYVDIAFDTPIDPNSVKTDDFRFSTQDGTNLEAYSVKVIMNSGKPTNVVRFIFKSSDNISNYFSNLKTIRVIVDKNSGLISTPEDSNGDNAYYIPSKNDSIGNIIAVGEN